MDTNTKHCPTCGNEMVKAYVEDGGIGDWCPYCKKSSVPRKKKSLSRAIIVVLPFALYAAFMTQAGRDLAAPLGPWGFIVPLAMVLVLLLATSLTDR